MDTVKTFDVLEATIADIHAAYRAGTLTARQLVQAYLDRIERFDRNGPKINSVISINPRALEEADRLDAALKKGGLVGPLHGIPFLMKDQADTAENATTLGSILFKDYMPGRDCFVVDQLKKAGGITLGKTTLGELGGGDTHGSLFGSTRNAYDLERTVGGSSGGSGVAVSSNFCTVGVGQEGFASIRRPSTWNGIVGMRPTAGLVSRSGVYAGWPSIAGSLGPMARTVTDLAMLLDCMVGYDPEDPVTAHGFGKAPKSFLDGLDKNALKGKRIGIIRESFGVQSEPNSDDFAKVTEVFEKAVADLKKAGAVLVDPIVIPDLNKLIATRASNPQIDDEALHVWLTRNGKAPLYKSKAEMAASPLAAQVSKLARGVKKRPENEDAYYVFLRAREQLMTNLLKVFADNQLEAIVHKSVEHQPTLIKDGVNPPYVDTKGVPHLNTFVVFVPSIAVPAGFTKDGLPAGITFLGRPYDDANMVRFAYAYEQATRHRRPPKSVS